MFVMILRIMRTLRLGVIGVGRLGNIHARVYTEIPGVSLIGVCDADLSRGQTVAQNHNTRFFSDHHTLLSLVEAVSIATPTQSHFIIAQDAIRAGKHVLIEKPITETIKNARALIRLAAKHKVIIQVGHVERFNSAFVATRALTHNPRFIECHRLNPFPNRSLDIGVVFDLMIHDIDIILGLVPSKITKIDAVGVSVLTPFEDIANVRLHFENGCIANLTASRISDEPLRKIRIFLNDSYISLDYQAQNAFCYKKEKMTITKTPLPIEKEEPIKKELESFVDCALNGKKPIISGEEARRALKVAIDITDQIKAKLDE